MIEAKFTKGKWKARVDDSAVKTALIYLDNKGGFDISGAPDCIANAYLIAEAPEMYSEIVSDISWLEQIKSKFVVGSYEFRSVCLRIKSKKKLLAKARGESV